MRPFPNAGSAKWQISTEGGSQPVWTRDGREIVYVDGQGYMVAVAVRSDARDLFDFSKPDRLFRFAPGGVGGERNWDVTADGDRFLRVAAASNDVEEGLSETGRSKFVLIQNWSEELKAPAPSK